MHDYDTLEQLNRLRAEGALSEGEFEREKVRLLAPEPAQPTAQRGVLIALGAALLLGMAVIVFVMLSNPAPEIANRTATSNPSTAAPGNASVAQQPAPAPAPTQPVADYAWATSQEMIGLNPKFVEARLGPAKEKSPIMWSFDVKGCNVSYGVKGTEIVTVEAQVSAACHPAVDGRTITPETSMGSLMFKGSDLRSTCVEQCGNAYDPTIDLYVPGAHVNGYVSFLYQGAYGDPSEDAMELWQRAIRRQHGVAEDDYDTVDYDWFQCVSGAPPEVVAAMKREKIGRVTIGRNLDDGCDYDRKK